MLNNVGCQQIGSDPNRCREDFRFIYTTCFQRVVQIDFNIETILQQDVSGLRKFPHVCRGNERLKDLRCLKKLRDSFCSNQNIGILPISCLCN